MLSPPYLAQPEDPVHPREAHDVTGERHGAAGDAGPRSLHRHRRRGRRETREQLPDLRFVHGKGEGVRGAHEPGLVAEVALHFEVHGHGACGGTDRAVNRDGRTCYKHGRRVPGMPKIAYQELARFAREFLAAKGVPEEEARAIAEIVGDHGGLRDHHPRPRLPPVCRRGHPGRGRPEGGTDGGG